MARLEQMPEPMRSHIAKTKLPKFETQPWATGPPLNARRVAIVSTAGLHQRDDRPFTFEPGDLSPTSSDLDGWFWEQTAAAKVLFAIKDRCLESEDKMLQLVGKLLLIPSAYNQG
jgi:hypothetical protein